MAPPDNVIVWLHGEVKSPPFSAQARLEAGVLLRRLQGRERLGMPHSRPLPIIGRRCHELRVVDKDLTWRIVYRVDSDAIIILEVFAKKSNETPAQAIQTCRQRLARYDG
jgi:phage-related protein